MKKVKQMQSATWNLLVKEVKNATKKPRTPPTTKAANGTLITELTHIYGMLQIYTPTTSSPINGQNNINMFPHSTSSSTFRYLSNQYY